MSIPHKIISIRGVKATVACGKKTHALDIRLVPKVKVGDYVLNEDKFAVYKMPKKRAQETLNLFKNA